jgi:hypothetical protein
MKVLKPLLNWKQTKTYYNKGKSLLTDPQYLAVRHSIHAETLKRPFRTEIINFLLSLSKNKTTYLEIGVRNPDHNYNHIEADTKYSVDPGVEFGENPVDFKMTSDEFFEQLGKNDILSSDIKFDVIFLDGLHLAYQADRDVENALKYIKNDGFIVMHDCSPPTEWHARESYGYLHTPAQKAWNGTTWKAFLKWRTSPQLHSCCIDADWGVGILSKTRAIGSAIAPANQFFEFAQLDADRKRLLNLIDFAELKRALQVP